MTLEEMKEKWACMIEETLPLFKNEHELLKSYLGCAMTEWVCVKLEQEFLAKR